MRGEIMHAPRLIGVLFASLIAAAGCGAPSSPSPSPSVPAPPAPSSAALDLSGRWAGSANDSQGATSVVWQLTQSGTDVSGTIRTTAVNPDDGSCSSCHRNKSGTVAGTLTGSTLTLKMSFAAGADGDPTPACSAILSGAAAAPSASSVVASYSGSDTCEGEFANGTMTMRR